MVAQCCTTWIFAVDWEVALHNHNTLSVMSENSTVSHVLPKTRFSGLRSCGRQCGSDFNHCDIIGPKLTEFGEITQTNSHYSVRAIQGRRFQYHAKAYLRPPVWIIVIYIRSCTVCNIWWIIGQIFATDSRVPLFSALVQGKTKLMTTQYVSRS